MSDDAVFKRDEYCCTLCGAGREHGFEIRVYQPKAGGAVTLCGGCFEIASAHGLREATRRFFKDMQFFAAQQDDLQRWAFYQMMIDMMENAPQEMD
jgi:hypothetical protein